MSPAGCRSGTETYWSRGDFWRQVLFSTGQPLIWLLIQKLEDLHLLRLDSCFEQGKNEQSIHEYQPAIRCLAGRRQQQITRSGDPRGAYERDRARSSIPPIRRLRSKPRSSVFSKEIFTGHVWPIRWRSPDRPGLVLQLGKRFPDHQPLLPSLETIETLDSRMTSDILPSAMGRSSFELHDAPHGGFESNAQSLRLWGGLNPPWIWLNLAWPCSGCLPGARLNRSRLNNVQTSQRKVHWKRIGFLQNVTWTESRTSWIGFWNPDAKRPSTFWQTPILHGPSWKDSSSVPRHLDPGSRRWYCLRGSWSGRCRCTETYTQEQWQEIHQSLDQMGFRMELTNLEDDLFEKTHHPVIPANRQWERWFMHWSVCGNSGKRFEEPLLHWKVSLPEVPRMFLNPLRILFPGMSSNAIPFKVRLSGVIGCWWNLPGFARKADRLLPERFGSQWKNAENEGQGNRVICDYMAGMTDQYANRIYSRFFLPNEGRFWPYLTIDLETILNQNLSDIDFADSLIFWSPKELKYTT